MKNKKLLIGIVLGAILLVGAGAFFFMSRNPEPVEEEIGTQEESLPSLKPSEIGLKLVISPNKQQFKVVVEKLTDVTNLEYEYTYDADNPQAVSEDDVKRVTRGGGGDEDIVPGQKIYESKFYDLGTCSSGRCRYDTGVEEIILLMKVTKKDGKEYQVEERLIL